MKAVAYSQAGGPERVLLWEAALAARGRTAQEYVVLPERQAVRLDDAVSLDVGASLGVPALTGHRCLTVSELAGTMPHCLCTVPARANSRCSCRRRAWRRRKVLVDVS
jgi:NADPH:quinone reductase-like Zn-dependent oxidoreductase